MPGDFVLPEHDLSNVFYERSSEQHLESGPVRWARYWITTQTRLQPQTSPEIYIIAKTKYGRRIAQHSDPEIIQTRLKQRERFYKALLESWTVFLWPRKADINAIESGMVLDRKIKLLTYVNEYSQRVKEEPTVFLRSPKKVAEREMMLSEAADNRKRLEALIANDWLGLKMLAWLKAHDSTEVVDLISSLFRNMNRKDLNTAVSTIAQLIQLGFVYSRESKLFLTRKGTELVEAIEKRSGIAFE